MREKIQALSLQVVLRMTSAPGDARSMARDAVAEGFRTIVAAGGDGTVNEVANGVAGSEVSFGGTDATRVDAYAELQNACSLAISGAFVGADAGTAEWLTRIDAVRFG